MQLIKGIYSKEDAQEIVQQIIQLKIKFHEGKLSSGLKKEEIEMREERINDLRNELSEFRKTIQEHTGPIDMNAVLNFGNAEIKAEKKNFHLINGIFDLDDAKEILMTAYYGKINFHKLKAWSKNERGEEGGDLHRTRALELQIDADQIKDLLLINSGNEKKVSLTCSLSLKFVSVDERPGAELKLLHLNS